ncbi:ribosome biogenesis atpase rix7 [Ophiostoma piceae UAMH 11346]|uniref:Ribosome biogenesis atpase rix7 n=1 Tax=Ophiostoma piceae (strain UAMH 11346) TaxID=1262450 RepID=S3CZ85_OPHP1|nr:ribosome biogenesis atpase rix7 [Ophiostoma piceae UAMH 11346]
MYFFRHDEITRAHQIAGDLEADFKAGKPGAVRPTVSALTAKLQAIRNHSLGRQKKKYLETLSEKVLDDRMEEEMAANAAEEKAAEEAASTAAAEAAAKTPAPATPATIATETTAADGVDVDMTAAPDLELVPALEGDATAAADASAATALTKRAKRLRIGDASADGAANGKLQRKRKRRRYQDSDDDDSDGEDGGKKKGVVPTKIALDGLKLEDIAGMDDILRDVIRLVWMPLRRGFDFKSSGSRPNEAVLLYGPSGCGKTLLANVIAAEARVPFFSVSGPSLVGGISGESETNIRNIFDEAIKQAPSLIFIDAIEAIASKQDFSGKGPMEMRMALTLTSCIDRLNLETNSGKYVIVLAATNKADSLDPLVRRRFGTEIAVRMPSQEARQRILETMTRDMKLAEDVDLKEIARMTPGFVGGDLQNVVKTAQLNYMDMKLEGILTSLRSSNGIPETDAPDVMRDFKLLNAFEDERRESTATAGVAKASTNPTEAEKPLFIIDTNDAAADAADSAVDVASTNGTVPTTPSAQQNGDATNGTESTAVEITMTEESAAGPVVAATGISAKNFVDAALSVLPAAKREGFSTIPNTTWKQVGAMEVLRKKLEMSIIGPIRYPDKYAAVGQKPMGGILLWGPPGCGKTLVAKAVANESKANFISIRGPELLNKWVGESERALRELFERARAMAPCIIFFDEMDALAAKRDDARSDGSARIVNTLLTELDGVVDRTGLFVIGATNRPDIIDPAIKRPGRLGESIFVGPPTAEDRVDILQTLYRNAIPGEDAAAMAESLEMLAGVAADARCTGFSGADLDQLLRAAGKSSLERTGLHNAEMPRILKEDWDVALRETQPSTSLAELKRYEKLH